MRVHMWLQHSPVSPPLSQGSHQTGGHRPVDLGSEDLSATGRDEPHCLVLPVQGRVWLLRQLAGAPCHTHRPSHQLSVAGRVSVSICACHSLPHHHCAGWLL